MSVLPRVSAPVDRLINVKSDGPQPSYVNLRDDRPIRAAGRLVSRDAGATYALQAQSTYALDLYGAALLYFPPARPVGDARKAQWIVAYAVKPTIPATLRVVRRYEFGRDVTLVRVQPR